MSLGGLSWQVCPTAMIDLLTDPGPARADAGMRAMMAMGKRDLAAIQAAADGAVPV